MSLFHSSRFSSRGINLIPTPCRKTRTSLGPSGPCFLRPYGSLSSRPTDALCYRSRNTRTASGKSKNGRIPKNIVKRHFTAGAIAQDRATGRSSHPSTPLVPLTETTDDPDIPTRVGRVMRDVPHPVSIITSTDPAHPPKTAFRGMTVSSVNTVTLRPETIVSFNVKVPSETLNAIQASSKFIVHFLAANESTALLSRLFSGGNENLPTNEKERGYRFTSPELPDELPRIEIGEPPLLRLKQDRPAGQEAIDFPFVFQCEYLPQSITVADHMIVLGKVTKVLSHPYLRNRPSAERSQFCLTYADQRFWKMGSKIPTRIH